MTRTLLAFALAACATPAAAADRTYSVTDFERVVVEGPYIVRLVTGRPSAAQASGSQAALDRVTIDTIGQTLRVRRNRNAWGGNPGAQEGVVTIELSTRTLRSAWLVGPARLDIDRAQGLRVDLTVEGSGQLGVADLDADNLSVGLRGSGRIALAGRARSLRADIQGSGDLAAETLRADDATLTASTAGTVALHVAREATVNANGLGEVRISGRGTCNVRGPGAGQVQCGGGSDQGQNRQPLGQRRRQ